MIAFLEEQVEETTNVKINPYFQLIITTDHNGIINQFPTCHIFQPSKINLAGSHQSGILKYIPRNQPIKFADVFRKISSHGNGTPISRAR